MSTPRDILLVEDDHIVADVLRRMLERSGYTVRIANDGIQALTVLGEARPTLLILDLILPGMNGFTILEYLQQQQISLPIIVISANPHHDEFMPMADIRHVLMKPFLFEELLDAVRATIGSPCPF